MDDAALMIRLLKRLKVEMNGAVTGAMQERGIVYPLNYGVSVPTIRGIAREYGPGIAKGHLGSIKLFFCTGNRCAS